MAESASPQSRKRWLTFYPLVAILVVWVVLYLPHLRTSPRWYGDETLTLEIGRSVFANAPADRSLEITFWHPSYSYQPGYAWGVGGAASLTGGDIVGARFLNTLLALTIAVTIFLGARGILGHIPSLFGAFLFLTYEQSIIHFRWIYPHNAVALGFLICLLALLRKAGPRPDWIAGLGLGIAALCHPLFAHGAIAAWVCRLKRPVSWIRMAIIPAMALATTMGITLWRFWPEPRLFQDMAELLAFFRNSSDELGGTLQMFQNIRIFFTHDLFQIGVLFGGLLCLTRTRLYLIGLFLFSVSTLLLINRQNIPLFYYQAVTLLPVMALAWAGGLAAILRWSRSHSPGRRGTRLLGAASFLLPLFFLVKILPAVASGKLVSRNDPWVTQNTHEVEQAAQWLNSQLNPDDLVICSANIGWLLNCRKADYIQATMWAGHQTFTFEKPFDHSRFRYPADLTEARFAVVGDIDKRWTFSQPNVPLILQRLQDERWPIVWQGPNYLVLENPKKNSSSPPDE